MEALEQRFEYPEFTVLVVGEIDGLSRFDDEAVRDVVFAVDALDGF
ncbi:hypothetical protein NDI76_16025 [Halogeometricum sp. S1BR25-6]|uniref:Uncharacterized protein n=1 Tax=Halogeometricum salsisoli TaxID=2950536 RepID=A0ABU2GHF0_9EURY|nr:hypothetical protein [Halogeometricum sp. S1BR25-6]MDS0300255.1 hypothetical protein [Halogeometricum sp. S1BR25-6]